MDTMIEIGRQVNVNREDFENDKAFLVRLAETLIDMDRLQDQSHLKLQTTAVLQYYQDNFVDVEQPS